MHMRAAKLKDFDNVANLIENLKLLLVFRIAVPKPLRLFDINPNCCKMALFGIARIWDGCVDARLVAPSLCLLTARSLF